MCYKTQQKGDTASMVTWKLLLQWNVILSYYGCIRYSHSGTIEFSTAVFGGNSFNDRVNANFSFSSDIYSSHMACCANCATQSDCFSYFFNINTKLCYLNHVHFDSPLGMTYELGWRYYITREGKYVFYYTTHVCNNTGKALF